MFTEEKLYNSELTEILYPDEGKLLQQKVTKKVYGSVSLADGRKQEDYQEIDEPKQPEKN